MQRQRNLNISFKKKDISVLHELKRRSVLDYVSTSGLTIDLIQKGILYEQQQRTQSEKETGLSV
jgi:hypothetical protein